MSYEPGKYDQYSAFATKVREATHAEGVVLIVFEGDKGSGFTVQARPSLGLKLPAILEKIAAELRRPSVK